MRRITLLAILTLVLPLALVSDFHLAQPGLPGMVERAQGQGQQLNQSPFLDCIPNVIITDAHWIDKKNGDDIIRVGWQTVSQAACQNFSAKQFQPTSGLQGSLNGASPGFRAGYNVKVTVIRSLGGEDTGSGTANGGLLGGFSADVQVPRNHLGQPKSCKIQIRGSGSGFGSKQARITGNGAPSMDSATQTSEPSSGSENFRSECLPNVTITGLTYTPGSSGQKDSVTVNWSATQPVSPCLRIINFGVVVRLKRVVGADSVGSSSARSNANSATVQLTGGKGQINTFEVTIDAQAFSPSPLNL